MDLIASNICWKSELSQQYCVLVFMPGLVKKTPIFDTASDTLTDLANVEHVVDYLTFQISFL